MRRGTRTIVAPGPVRGRRKRQPRPWIQQASLLLTAAICLVLLVATLSEFWIRTGLDRQVATIRASNTLLTVNITTTQRMLTLDASDATIERIARSWGYIQQGNN